MGVRTYYKVLGGILCVLVLGFAALMIGSSLNRSTPVSQAAEDAETDRIVDSLLERDACFDALEAAGESYDRLSAKNPAASAEQFNALKLPPLSACDDAQAWPDAARKKPQMVGLTHQDAVDASLLFSRCAVPGASHTPVCRDAVERGLFN